MRSEDVSGVTGAEAFFVVRRPGTRVVWSESGQFVFTKTLPSPNDAIPPWKVLGTSNTTLPVAL